jgi:hypothetical protein
MPNEGLEREVTSPSLEPQLAALKKRIGFLQIQYGVLFVASLVLLLWNIAEVGEPIWRHVVWALALGGAVVTRLYRQSQVAKYNSLLMGGGPAPLS